MSNCLNLPPMQSVFTFNIKISLFIRDTNLVEVALPSEHSEGMVPSFVQAVQTMGKRPAMSRAKKMRKHQNDGACA